MYSVTGVEVTTQRRVAMMVGIAASSPAQRLPDIRADTMDMTVRTPPGSGCHSAMAPQLSLPHRRRY